jgi:hypothetical protein
MAATGTAGSAQQSQGFGKRDGPVAHGLFASLKVILVNPKVPGVGLESNAKQISY